MTILSQLLLLNFLPLIVSQFQRASFHTICTSLVNENVDPVVLPGKVGYGHAHRVVGANGFNSRSTPINPSNFTNDPATSIYKSSTGTTCDIPLDLSAYWQPILYYQLSSNLNLLPVRDGPALIYYNFYAGVKNFPDDFEMLVGNPKRTINSGDPDNPAVFFEYPVGTKLYNFPNVSKTCGFARELRAHVFFPNCAKVDSVTGKLLRDPATGRYILRYPTGFRSGAEVPFKPAFNYEGTGCPAGDLVLPQVHQAFHYDLSNICPKGKLIPGRFVWSNGNFDGRGLHADFLNGWDPKLLDNIITQCRAQQCTPNGNGCPINICQKSPQPAYTQREDFLDYDGPVTGIPPSYYNQNYWGFNPVLIPSSMPTISPSFNPTSVETTIKPTTKSPSSIPTISPTILEQSFSPSVMTLSDNPSSIPTMETTTFSPTSVSSIKPSSITTTIKPSIATNYDYLGCYGDNLARAMAKNLGKASSLLDCYNVALANKYKLFGLQNGGECWVSNNITRSEMYGQCGSCASKNCGKPSCDCAAMKCANGESCGDGFGTMLFNIKSIETVTSSPATTVKPSAANNYGYLGCYGDSSVRAMAKSLGKVISVLTCYNFALVSKYQLFGLQYGGECWVSNNITRSEMYGQCGSCASKNCGKPTCDCTAMKCASGESCGDGFGTMLFNIATSTPV